MTDIYKTRVRLKVDPDASMSDSYEAINTTATSMTIALKKPIPSWKETGAVFVANAAVENISSNTGPNRKYTLDKTWQEIYNAHQSGKTITIIIKGNSLYVSSIENTSSNDGKPIITLSNDYMGDLGTIGNFYADSVNSYPVAMGRY